MVWGVKNSPSSHLAEWDSRDRKVNWLLSLRTMILNVVLSSILEGAQGGHACEEGPGGKGSWEAAVS